MACNSCVQDIMRSGWSREQEGAEGGEDIDVKAAS